MKEPTPITIDLHFPTDKPNANGCVFTKKAIENALKDIKTLPIIGYGENKRVVGVIESGKLNGETLTASGKVWESIADGTQDMEYTYENGKLNILSFGIVPKNRGIKQ